MSQRITKITLGFTFLSKMHQKMDFCYLPSSVCLRTSGAKLQGSHFFYDTLTGSGCQELLPIHGDHCRHRRYEAAGSVVGLLSPGLSQTFGFACELEHALYMTSCLTSLIFIEASSNMGTRASILLCVLVCTLLTHHVA